MKVFVSHSFADEQLATILVGILKEKGIDGYMAQRNPKYEQFIHQKIRAEIAQSDYMVAILTDDSLKSASVNQEIGYALCKDVPIVIMKENHAILGVLTYGREPEEFTRDTFEKKAMVITNYLLVNWIPKRPANNTTSSEEFLRKRRLLVDVDSESFAISDYTRELYNYCGLKEPGDSKPFVLFSACPKNPIEIEVNSEPISSWITSKQYVTINSGQFEAPFLKAHQRQLDLDSTIYRSTLREGELVGYLELHQNGYVAEGITWPLIYPIEFRTNEVRPGLHLTFLIGTWWAFLTFCKNYYQKIENNEEIEFLLAIHNSKALTLYGFGGKVNDKGTRWAEPHDSMWWHKPLPTTNRQNISLNDTKRVSEMNEETISKLVRKFSDKISNAFQQETSRCYNHDGSFNFELFRSYSG